MYVIFRAVLGGKVRFGDVSHQETMLHIFGGDQVLTLQRSAKSENSILVGTKRFLAAVETTTIGGL